MIIDRHIDKGEEEKIAQLYGMKELLTENEWVQLFQKQILKELQLRWWHDCRNNLWLCRRARMECILTYSE